MNRVSMRTVSDVFKTISTTRLMRTLIIWRRFKMWTTTELETETGVPEIIIYKYFKDKGNE